MKVEFKNLVGAMTETHQGFIFVGKNSGGNLNMSFNKKGEYFKDHCPVGSPSEEEILHLQAILS